MVSEVEKKGKTVYLCEFCGFGYEDVDAAERCEEYCDTHGKFSQEITKKAIYKPAVRVMSVAA
jgi:rubrerythrin